MRPKTKLSPWLVKNSKYIFKDRWIKVRADHCITQEGTVISPYYVLEYPHWVHVVVIDEMENILINQQYRHGVRAIISELPCGTIKSVSEKPLVAAKRELMEETGYTGKFTLAGIASPNPATHTNMIYTYLVTKPVKKVTPAFDPREIVHYEFTPLTQILEMIEKKQFLQALHISSLFLGLRKANIKLPA